MNFYRPFYIMWSTNSKHGISQSGLCICNVEICVVIFKKISIGVLQIHLPLSPSTVRKSLFAYGLTNDVRYHILGFCQIDVRTNKIVLSHGSFNWYIFYKDETAIFVYLTVCISLSVAICLHSFSVFLLGWRNFPSQFPGSFIYEGN